MVRKKRKQAGGNWCNKVRQTEKTLRNQSTITKLNNGKTHSILKILTFSLAEITLEELFTKTFSANNLNSASIISTLPVA